VGVSGDALTATPTGLFWNFSSPIFSIFQLNTPPPGSDVVWQFLAGMVGMTNELVREGSAANQVIVDGSGLVQIASTVIAPLEINTDTTLTADRRGPIVIAADDVTLDCANHIVTGSGSGIGIHAAGRRGVTITRCVVSGFAEGIALEDTSESTLSENAATENVSVGIRLTGADGNRVSGNHVADTRGPSQQANGLVLASSSGNQVEWNTVEHSDLAGILVGDDSQSNDFVANVSSFNGGAGFDLTLAFSNTLKRNTATRNGDFGFIVREGSKRNKLLDNSACLNVPNDATELRAGNRSNANVWALNLFCSPAF
jgi:parallel beta-helix repeat protein